MELDEVVGSRRLPTFDDRDSLPYINAGKKSFDCTLFHCWVRTVSTPSDIFEYAHLDEKKASPHVATEDIYSDGFRIPD